MSFQNPVCGFDICIVLSKCRLAAKLYTKVYVICLDNVDLNIAHNDRD